MGGALYRHDQFARQYQKQLMFEMKMVGTVSNGGFIYMKRALSGHIDHFMFHSFVPSPQLNLYIIVFSIQKMCKNASVLSFVGIVVHNSGKKLLHTTKI